MKHPHDMTIDELVGLRVVDDGQQILEQMPRLSGDLCRGGRFKDAEGEAWGTFGLGEVSGGDVDPLLIIASRPSETFRPSAESSQILP